MKKFELGSLDAILSNYGGMRSKRVVSNVPYVWDADQCRVVLAADKTTLRVQTNHKIYSSKRCIEVAQAVSRFGRTVTFDASFSADACWGVCIDGVVYYHRDCLNEGAVGGAK